MLGVNGPGVGELQATSVTKTSSSRQALEHGLRGGGQHQALESIPCPRIVSVCWFVCFKRGRNHSVRS